MPTTTAASRIVIRPLTEGDGDALLAAFERLSEASRYQRFLSAMPLLTDAQLRYLTNVDQRAHVALAAIDPTDGIVGVGRFVRVSGYEAEPAIAMVDAYQGQGIGTALLRALTDCARRQGVTRYRAMVLADNPAMLRLLSGVGHVRSTRAGASLDVAVELATSACA